MSTHRPTVADLSHKDRRVGAGNLTQDSASTESLLRHVILRPTLPHLYGQSTDYMMAGRSLPLRMIVPDRREELLSRASYTEEVKNPPCDSGERQLVESDSLVDRLTVGEVLE